MNKFVSAYKQYVFVRLVSRVALNIMTGRHFSLQLPRETSPKRSSLLSVQPMRSVLRVPWQRSMKFQSRWLGMPTSGVEFGAAAVLQCSFSSSILDTLLVSTTVRLPSILFLIAVSSAFNFGTTLINQGHGKYLPLP